MDAALALGLNGKLRPWRLEVGLRYPGANLMGSVPTPHPEGATNNLSVYDALDDKVSMLRSLAPSQRLSGLHRGIPHYSCNACLIHRELRQMLFCRYMGRRHLGKLILHPLKDKACPR